MPPTAAANKREYLKTYYQLHRAEIRNKQRSSYEQKYRFASKELSKHLQVHPLHALGIVRSGACADCERLMIRPAVCLECGRMALGQLDFHLRQKHGLRAAEYKEKWRYGSRKGLVSPDMRNQLSKRFRSPAHLNKLNKYRVPVAKLSQETVEPNTETLQAGRNTAEGFGG